MGRHSRPGPGESFGEPDKPADVPERNTGRFPRLGDDVAGGDAGAGDAGYEPSPLTDTARRRIADFEGGHRSETGRRGVSLGVIAALVTVVVVVGAVILWRFFGDAMSHRSTDAAEKCLAGAVNVGVVVDPSIAANVGKIAESFNASVTPIGDRCVKMVVTAADSDRVVDGFVADWPGDLGERPALWIPASSIAEARLQATAGKQVVSDTRSLVSSPVVVAVRPHASSTVIV